MKAKTKVIITIEVEESFDETNDLQDKMLNTEKKGLKIKDIFDPEADVMIKSRNISWSAITTDSVEEPEPLKMDCIMYTRGIKIKKEK